MRHFLSLVDFSKEEILDILALAKKIKNDAKAGKHEDYMHKKILGMIFEKNRTFFIKNNHIILIFCAISLFLRKKLLTAYIIQFF